MQHNLGYTAWLLQQDSPKSTLELSFADNTGVLFSLTDHTTSLEAGREPERQPQEPNLD